MYPYERLLRTDHNAALILQRNKSEFRPVEETRMEKVDHSKLICSNLMACPTCMATVDIIVMECSSIRDRDLKIAMIYKK